LSTNQQKKHKQNAMNSNHLPPSSKRNAAIAHLRKLADTLGAKLSFEPSSRAIVNAHKTAIARSGGNHQRVGSDRRLADFEDDQIIVGWEAGKSVIELSDFHDISRQAVYDVLKKHGYSTERGAPRISRLVTA
jgi:hypothetical protein